MATNLQNFTAIGNALVDGVASNTQLTKLGDAIVALYSDAQIGAAFPGVLRADLTSAQKATIAMDYYKKEAKKLLRLASIATDEAAIEATKAANAAAAGDLIP